MSEMQLNLNVFVGPFKKRVGIIERNWHLILPKNNENFEFFPTFFFSPFTFPFFLHIHANTSEFLTDGILLLCSSGQPPFEQGLVVTSDSA